MGVAATWASGGVVLGLGPDVQSPSLLAGLFLAGGGLVVTGIIEVARHPLRVVDPD